MRVTCRLVAVLALAAPLSAQVSIPPIIPSPTPAIAGLKQYLNLSDSQVTSLLSIVQQKMLVQQQVEAQISQKNQTLQTLLASASPSPTTVGHTLIDIQNLQKQLTPTVEPYHTQALAILTQSQATLLANLNTALQLQTPACEAVSVNLLVLPSQASIFGVISVVTPLAACPSLPFGIVPVFTPGGPILTLPGGALPTIPPPPGQ